VFTVGGWLVALLGDLDTFPLDEVLRHLARTGKTGCIAIEGGPGEARLWLDQGMLIAVDVPWAHPGVDTAEVVFELLRCPTGSFTFTTEASPSSRGHEDDADDVGAALAGAYRLLDEWHELLTVVPSLDHQITLRSQLDTAEITLDTPTWATLVAVGSGKAIAQLAVTLDVSALESLRRARDLVVLGAATLTEPAFSRPVGQSRRPRNPVSSSAGPAARTSSPTDP
jgi:hypothetical protein